MSEQSQSKFRKSSKSFGAPRMRATQLLDVLKDEGQDTTELEEQLESAVYIDEDDLEPTQDKSHQAQSNTYAQLAPKPSVLKQKPNASAYTEVASQSSHGQTKGRASSSAGANAASSVPPIGSFIPGGSSTIPTRDAFNSDALDNEIDFPEVEFDPDSAMAKLAALAGSTETAAESSLGHRRPSSGNPGVRDNIQAHSDKSDLGIAYQEPKLNASAPKQPKFQPGMSFYATDDELADIEAQMREEIESMANQATDDLYRNEPTPYVSPAQRRAARAAFSGSRETNPEELFPVAPSHLNKSNSQGAYQDSRAAQGHAGTLDDSFNDQEELKAYQEWSSQNQPITSSFDSIVNTPAHNTSETPVQTPAYNTSEIDYEVYSAPQPGTTVGVSYHEDSEPASANSSSSTDPYYENDEVSRTIRSRKAIDAYSSQQASIQNNYIPDATPVPMPTFTPNAYASPYEDAAATTAATHVVDGDVLPDDYDPVAAMNNAEYMAFLANKHAENELRLSQESNEPIYHPWTLPKNRISKYELLQRQAQEKAQAELSLNPMYRLQMEVRDSGLGNFNSMPQSASVDPTPQVTENLAPPPQAHLLAQDAAMGAPVDNPLLMQSAGGRLIASIDLHGGMLSQLIYQRESGQLLDLLYHAPWLKDNYYFREPNLEHHMAGEWPCIPFGWAVNSEEANRPIAQHGFACQGKWQLVQVLHSQAEFLQFVDNPDLPLEENDDPDSVCGVVLGYEYPEELPLQKILRSIYINDSDVLLNFTIYAKQDCKVSMAAYPLFPMNPENDHVLLDIDGDGVVYPRQYEPGMSRFLPKSHFLSLDSVALRKDFVNRDGNGLIVDATMLPFNYPTEEVVQMLNPKGRARLYYPNKQLHVILKWEEEKLPNCVVWISNGGRQYEPWNGQSYCVGIAPMIGAWDLADDALKPNNLIEQYGQKTYIQLKAGQPFSFSYSLFVEDLLPQEQQ